MDPPTIIALKQAFLERATRQLAQPLAPSRAWQRKNDLRGSGHGSVATVAADNDAGKQLPPKIVDDALVRTNQLLLLHVRRVHAPAAMRHVAEQLDQLYQAAGDELVAAPGDASSEVLDRGVDYTTSKAIFDLPATWDDPHEIAALPLEARRYAEQVSQLQALAERRAATVGRVRQLRGMVSLLEGVSPADAPAQESLVTRNGPVESELERMRVLLARVGDRVASLPVPALALKTTLRSGETAPGIDTDMGVDTVMRVDDVRYVEEIGRQRAQTLLGLF